MATNKKTITEGAVIKMIEETAKFKTAKKEIWKKAIALNEELKTLQEGHQGFAASFGFDTAGDTSNVSKTGFVQDIGPISSLTSLGAEIQAANEAAIAAEAKAAEDAAINENMVDVIKELQKEIASLKAGK